MSELTLDATIANLDRVTDFVNEELEKIGCSFKAMTQIDIVIDELFSNIAYYAYKPNVGPVTVLVDVVDDPACVFITFMDNGKPFNPLEARDPDTTLSAEDRKIGGLGIFLVKKTMDEVSYEFADGKNILRIKKSVK